MFKPRNTVMPGFEDTKAYGFEVKATCAWVIFAAYNSFRYQEWGEETLGM
jgi:hypothetical protein